MIRSVAFATMAGALLMGSTASAFTPTERAEITAALRPGTIMSGHVYRVGLPRNSGAAAFGGYAAFEELPNGKAIVVGEVCLLPSEVDGVVAALRKEGIAATPLRDQVHGSTSHTVFVHILGQGNAVTLAQDLRRGLTMTGTAISAASPPSTERVLFATEVERIIGERGTSVDGMLAFGIPHASGVSEVNVAELGGGRVAGSGDVELGASEMGPAVAALRSHGFEVTSMEEPGGGNARTLRFVHFWRVGSPAQVAGGLKEMLSRLRDAT